MGTKSHFADIRESAAHIFLSPKEEDRRNNVNFIRFLAAALVIYVHMYVLTGGHSPSLFGVDASAIAVRVFFVLSGYLIFTSYQRDSNIPRYLVRRVVRIFPGLIFVVLLTTLIIGPLVSTLSFGEYFRSGDTLAYLKNCLMFPVYNLPGVFENNPYPMAVNGSLWTLPVEFLMYLVLPGLCMIFNKLNILKQGLIGMAVLTFSARLANVVLFPDYHLVIWGTDWMSGLIHIPYFFAGTLFAICDGLKRLNLQVAFMFTLLLAVLNFGEMWMTEILNFILLPYVVMSFSYAVPAVFGRVFAVNDYSYGLYLWGFLVQQLCINYLGADFLGPVLYAGFCTVIAFICAMMSWHIVEQPFSKMGKRLTKRLRNSNLPRVKQES